MQSVGQKLRQAREAQGRTLEYVHAKTRISLRVLEAIEADETTGISSAFLYKSFVKQFADCLHVEHSELFPAIQSMETRFPVPLRPGEELNPPLKLAALPVGRKKNSRLLLSVSSFALVVVACSGIYSVWQKLVPTHPASGGTAASAGQSNPSSFVLELSATEPAWLSIIADGKQSFNGILEKAETKVLEGHRTARVRAANAGAVIVVFNGKTLGALGPRGQQRTILFTKNNYEILRGTGTAQVSELTISPSAEPKLPLALLHAPGF
jgi:transcriptional regulator with XRE-family HTH domain